MLHLQSLILILGCFAYSQAAFDVGFSMGRSYPVEEGDKDARVWCRATESILDNSRICIMNLPSGIDVSMNLTSGEVNDLVTLRILEGYTAYTDEEGRTCGLIIDEVMTEDLGQYTCQIGSATGRFQFGFVSLLNNEEGFVKDVRLPRHFVPENYLISLIPFIIPDNYTVKGSVDIDGKVEMIENMCNWQCIVLHTRDTYIAEDSITVIENGLPVLVAGTGYDLDRDFLIIFVGKPLLPGSEIKIHIDFVSQIQDNLAGFYRSSYFNTFTNETKTIATTQFESTDARRAFPCLDEPDLKAVFTVWLGHTRDTITLSNMNMVDQWELDAEYFLDIYQPSVKMSTYLLAFIVSDFSFTFAPDHERFMVWGPEDRISELKYAAEIGPKIINYYEELFDYKFPLDKMDMAAVPDFQSGAMENWGLITYRDTNILYDEVNYAESNRMRVATVVAHELAHQWFGNLVTMKWWNDLWLNEGFASYIEYLGADIVAPEMRLMDQILNLELHDVFYLDSLPSSHAISIDIQNPIFEENFDRISYGKGCVLIRMMSNFLTAPTFRKGLANYFKDNAFSNAAQDDLWKALGNQAHADGVLDVGITVKQIMDTWTLQKGYPVVSVSLKDGSWEIRQEKFNLDRSFKVEKEEPLWWVPISFTSLDGDLKDSSVDLWLNDTSVTVSAPTDAADMVYIFNVGEEGYYRVNYDPETWQRIISDFPRLNYITRAQMYNDALNLARAGLMSYQLALQLMTNLETETDFVALRAADTEFLFFERMLGRDERFVQFQQFVRTVLQTVYDEVSTSNSTDFVDVRKRARIMKWACSVGNQDCIERALSQFSAWKSASTDYESAVEPDSKTWVYCYGIKYGTEEDWDLAWQRLQDTNVVLERQELIKGLGCTRDIAQIDKYLMKSINPQSTIRNQDKRYVYQAIGNSDESSGSQRMLEWLDTNWEEIKEFYKDTFVYNVKNMVLLYPETGNTPEQRDSLANFLKKHRAELGSSVKVVEQGVDKITANIRWRNLYYEEVLNWFSAFNSANST